jgi:aconitase B
MNYEEEINKLVKEKIHDPLDAEFERKVRDELLPTMLLSDFVTTVSEIRCDECNKIDKSYMDEWEAAEHFLDEGWEIVGKKCLCKDCISKKD